MRVLLAATLLIILLKIRSVNPGVLPDPIKTTIGLKGSPRSRRSPVQVVNEMVLMISGMRHFEAAQHALRALSETQQLSTRPQGS